METINGRIKKVDRRSTFKALDMGGATLNRCTRYLCLTFLIFLSGCAGLKKAALIAGASSIGAGVGSVVSGTVGSIAGAASGATAGVVATGLGGSKKGSGQPLEVTAETVVQEAPANFFSLLQQLVEMGGWLLGLVILLPMILGWILPGPLQKKKKGSSK